jgi:hypothetical protein
MVIVTPCACGAGALLRRGASGSRRRRGPGGRDAFPPTDQGDVLSAATAQPADSPCRATRWSLDDLGTVLRQQHRRWCMSRSSLWRMLDAADLKPPRRVYGLHSHAPACGAKARDMWQLDVNALRFSAHGRVVSCTEEKTGRQMLQRQDPTLPAPPGKPEKREHADIRHGARALLASFVVPTGQVRWHLGVTRTRTDCAAHLTHVVDQLPPMPRDEWGVDHLKTHGSLEVCRLGASWCDPPCLESPWGRGVARRACLRDPAHQQVLHLTPLHGSWLNQVA